jgi:VanZ family protein
LAKSRLRFVPALAWTIVILKLLLSESSGIPRFWWLDFPHVDKLIHMVLFGVNAVLVMFALDGNSKSPSNIHPIGFVLLWTLILGAGTEMAQHFFLVTRSGNLLDLLADLAGGALPLLWISLRKRT